MGKNSIGLIEEPKASGGSGPLADSQAVIDSCAPPATAVGPSGHCFSCLPHPTLSETFIR